MSRSTLSEMAWPLDEESARQARQWTSSVSTQVLAWTWRGYDALRAAVLETIDLTQPLEQLERDIARHHFREINQIWARETGGYSSVTPHHEYPEMETRSAAPAKPPSYDFAFTWNANPRIVWPIEAKVIKTPSSLADYLRDTEKFTLGIAAPLSNEGGQIAYLLRGNATEFFCQLQKRLSTKLSTCAGRSSRDHRSSRHSRTNSPNLILHHLVMLC